MRIFHIVQLALSIRQGNIESCINTIKYFTQTYQFRSDAYRLYYLALGTSAAAQEQFKKAEDQKYLLRQIKALDGLLMGESIVNSATIVDIPDIEKCVPTSPNPVLLTLYGHRLAAGGSFAPAQVYYFRARKLCKIDPMLELSIGISYLHRAMQRQASNRHIIVLQAFTFLFQYRQLIYDQSSNHPGILGGAMRQQAEYNLARAFQQLGLFTFAARYYEDAIRISEEMGGLGKRDLVFECAHNLGLMFTLSGNYEAAKVVTERYLVL